MNIFFLSLLFDECAQFHGNKHVIKMILEATQLLWSAFYLAPPCSRTGACLNHKYLGANRLTDWPNLVPAGLKIYRLTHANHPMAIWVRQHPNNFTWLLNLALALCREYTYRYSDEKVTKQHACQTTLEWMQAFLVTNQCRYFCRSRDTYKVDQKLASQNIPAGCTPVPLCMPEQYYDDDLIKAYRQYYSGDKREIMSWKKREPPAWW